MILAHALIAISGIISGVGFAIANIIESLFIVLTISQVKTFGAETHIKISEFFIASSSFQDILLIFVIFNTFCFSGFKSVLELLTIHLLSNAVISLNQ